MSYLANFELLASEVDRSSTEWENLFVRISRTLRKDKRGAKRVTCMKSPLGLVQNIVSHLEKALIILSQIRVLWCENKDFRYICRVPMSKTSCRKRGWHFILNLLHKNRTKINLIIDFSMVEDRKEISLLKSALMKLLAHMHRLHRKKWKSNKKIRNQLCEVCLCTINRMSMNYEKYGCASRPISIRMKIWLHQLTFCEENMSCCVVGARTWEIGNESLDRLQEKESYDNNLMTMATLQCVHNSYIR